MLSDEFSPPPRLIFLTDELCQEAVSSIFIFVDIGDEYGKQIETYNASQHFVILACVCDRAHLD